jgi:hypothetical protein
LNPSKFPHKSVHSNRIGWSSVLALRTIIGMCFWLSSALALAGDVELNPAHPDRYTVVKGDTLWDIAGKFLSRPWQWPEIWHGNPQIENPHLIYPGDVIVLNWVNGRPRLQVGVPSEMRLSPQVRSTPLAAAIPTIPMKVISPFLTRPQVVSANTLGQAPYVVALADEHIVGGAGNRIYVRSIEDSTYGTYTVFRTGIPYQDAETGEILGYEALYMGDSHLEQTGDPATLLLTRTDKEIRIGDRLLPLAPEPFRINFAPHAPRTRIRGHIISVVDGVSQIGQYSVVALDRGTADGIEAGHVLEIWQKGPVIRDIAGSRYGESVTVPEQRAGQLMVFRPFERVSYALVMRATRFIHVLDIAQTP